MQQSSVRGWQISYCCFFCIKVYSEKKKRKKLHFSPVEESEGALSIFFFTVYGTENWLIQWKIALEFHWNTVKTLYWKTQWLVMKIASHNVAKKELKVYKWDILCVYRLLDDKLQILWHRMRLKKFLKLRENVFCPTQLQSY